MSQASNHKYEDFKVPNLDMVGRVSLHEAEDKGGQGNHLALTVSCA